VATGDTIVILEAMKMENSIVAGRDGTIRSISVVAGDAVNAGDVVAEIE
jgi:biotin carboxyl carrier protein